MKKKDIDILKSALAEEFVRDMVKCAEKEKYQQEGIDVNDVVLTAILRMIMRMCMSSRTKPKDLKRLTEDMIRVYREDFKNNFGKK